ncbi:MAG: hypothetical protein JW705_07560 [Methanosarcinaceae archaeon]|nr:hypothetical protein [Methanosarcinaceae archaeon]
MSDKILLPVIDKTSRDPGNKNTTCGSCSSGRCRGGFGIRPGSEKEEVYWNIFFYLTMGMVMFVAAYLITRLLSAID